MHAGDNVAEERRKRLADSLIEASRGGRLRLSVQRVSKREARGNSRDDSRCFSDGDGDDLQFAATAIVQEILHDEVDIFELRESLLTPESESWEYEADSAEENDADSEIKFQEIVRKRLPPVPTIHSSTSSLPPALESSPYLCPVRPDGKARKPRAQRHRRLKRAAEVSSTQPRDVSGKISSSRQNPIGEGTSMAADAMPDWLVRETKAVSEGMLPIKVPVSPPPPPLGGMVPGIKPSVDLNMYSRPVELPWKLKPKSLQRGRKQRPPWQHPNDNKSLSPAPPNSLAAPGKPPVSLPKLAGEEKLSAWRENMVNSAMQLAKSCDVPLGLLPKAGTFVL